ncbi:MAG: minor capsid protein [Paenibacillus dendritiformis]|uniref:minor capsid protein n=1 Tax=uncultured Paenibacillus sp. TaxID=227322 RepID=UPI0025EE5113|nr:minor capsid protein [uncultured Paenibacillus sp.]MDU5141073.1 minor capsid protein [Paenibacillus dendritiformis]
MAAQTNESYWLHRQLANEAKAVNYTEFKLRELGRHYRKATKKIEAEIARFYKKYAGPDGKIDMATASVYVKNNLTRLSELKRRIQEQLAEVMTREAQLTKGTLSRIYQDGYYKTNYELQRFRANYRNVDRLSPAHIDRAISTAWSGRSYSARIWGRHQRLSRAVDEIMTQGVILGHSNDRMSRQLSERMSVSYSNAKRLVRTESNYVYNQGTLQGYADGGIEEYEYIATLDMRTSTVCQGLDGKRYKLREAQVGYNYPPMHPNCRSTTVPYFPDEILPGKRSARDSEGDTMYVHGNLTYPEWAKRYLQPAHDEKLE